MQMIKVVEQIPVLNLPYDPAERARWKDEAAAHKKTVTAPTPTMDHITDVTGFLGRAKETLYKRPKRNYLEWKLAQHLVEERGYPPETLVNEEYYLSWEAYQQRDDRDRKTPGTELLRRAFHDGFFKAFDEFLRLNRDLFLTDKGARRDPASLHVDLAGVHLDRRPVRRREPQCGFWQLKDATAKSDQPQNHHKALLGFVQYMAKHHEEFVRSYKWIIEARFVFCHPQDSPPSTDEFIESQFRVPERWQDA